ncbi:MAG: hypothetical protein WC852_06250 [Candidatus Nanoarchaeia archaeon]|jgi:hypothetical protein
MRDEKITKYKTVEGIGSARGAAELMPADMGYAVLEAEDKGDGFEWTSGKTVFYDHKTSRLLRSQGVDDAGLIERLKQDKGTIVLSPRAKIIAMEYGANGRLDGIYVSIPLAKSAEPKRK